MAFPTAAIEALSPFAYYCWAAGALFLAIITLA